MAGKYLKRVKSRASIKQPNSGGPSNGAIVKSMHKAAVTLSSLPPELRWMTWELAMPEPRVVAIRHHQVSQYTWSNCPIPNLLHVCRESRQVALKYYQLAFPLLKNRGRGVGHQIDGIPRIFFDYSRDILHFSALLRDACEMINGMGARNDEVQNHWLGDVRYLAIDVDTHWRVDGHAKQRMVLLFLPTIFKSLEQLLVMQDNRWGVYNLEGKGDNIIERVKEMPWMDERLGQSPKERDFVDCFDRIVEVKECGPARTVARLRDWKPPQLKFVELVREWG